MNRESAQMPKGSIPLAREIIESREQVFWRLLDHYDAEPAPAGMSGTGRHDRFAVYAQAGPAAIGGEPMRELARCSSLKRAEIVAEAYLERDWKVECAFDLDTLDGLEPLAEVGDIIRLRGESDVAPFTVAMVDIDTERYIGEDSKWIRISECEIVERIMSEDDRWPVRHQVAAVRRIIVFNTVAG